LGLIQLKNNNIIKEGVNMSRLDEATKLLDTLQERAPDLMDLAIVRTNGLVILSKLKVTSQDQKSTRLLGAMASALFSISKRAAGELVKGQFQSINIEIDTGNIFLIYTGKVILITITKPEPNLGLVSLELEDAAEKLNKIFG
ncbi:MAG: roadblock/LC7 domain-containing protein, partial [Spirochaetes bacterium]|nr:roadblock/LC7 domain-containing protein [Spirochaetota bacterium]